MGIVYYGYLILLLLPMLTAGKAVQQPQQQQNLEKWQLEQLELQHRQSEGKGAYTLCMSFNLRDDFLRLWSLDTYKLCCVAADAR